jgi:hypothetical protein
LAAVVPWADVIGVLAVVCGEEVHALVEFLDGATVRQQRRRGGGQFEVFEDLVNDVRVGKEGQHDHRSRWRKTVDA